MLLVKAAMDSTVGFPDPAAGTTAGVAAAELVTAPEFSVRVANAVSAPLELHSRAASRLTAAAAAAAALATAAILAVLAAALVPMAATAAAVAVPAFAAALFAAARAPAASFNMEELVR